MFKRHKKIGTQTSLFAPNCIQISVFEQTRKKFLDQILRLFSSTAVPPNKSVKRSPISSAEYFQCFVRSRRLALRLQYDTPTSGRERCAATIRALGVLGPIHGVRFSLHSAVRKAGQAIYFARGPRRGAPGLRDCSPPVPF